MRRAIVRNALFVCGAAVTALTTGCGGGGGPDLPNPAPAPAPACAGSTLDDAWITARTSCVKPGQQFVALSSGQWPTTNDVAVVVKQQVFFDSFTAVTPARHFARFLCLRNAPDVASFSSWGPFVASDIAAAMKASNAFVGSALPPRVSAVSITLAGDTQPSPLLTTCDPAMHMLIVDYKAGTVESVNPNATLQTYDTAN